MSQQKREPHPPQRSAPFSEDEQDRRWAGILAAILNDPGAHQPENEDLNQKPPS